MHVTDPHLFADPDGSLRGTVTLSALQKVLEHVAKTAWQFDLVALTGDLIQDDSREAYGRVRDLLTPLGVPVHCVPGNHDIRRMMREELSSPPFVYCGSVEIGNWLIACVDSCLSGSAAGCVDDAELERLQSVLEKSDAPNALVCLHHPPVKVGSKWLDSVGLQNASEFLGLLSGFSAVKAAIFGHVHQNVEETVDGIQIIGTPSTCRQFKPGSDDFAVDDNPPGYRRISLLADGRIEHELVWLENATLDD